MDPSDAGETLNDVSPIMLMELTESGAAPMFEMVTVWVPETGKVSEDSDTEIEGNGAKEAEQESVVPPSMPLQDQLQGPLPIMAEGVPALHRLTAGATLNTPPLLTPQIPLTGGGGVLPVPVRLIFKTYTPGSFVFMVITALFAPVDVGVKLTLKSQDEPGVNVTGNVQGVIPPGPAGNMPGSVPVIWGRSKSRSSEPLLVTVKT